GHAKHDGQNKPRKDDEYRHFLVAMAGLGQLLLGLGDLARLKDVQALKRTFYAIGGLGPANDALPFARGGLDYAGLQFFAALVKRLYPLGHRVLHSHRGIDREHGGHGGDPGENRAYEDDVEAE